MVSVAHTASTTLLSQNLDTHLFAFSIPSLFNVFLIAAPPPTTDYASPLFCKAVGCHSSFTVK